MVSVGVSITTNGATDGLGGKLAALKGVCGDAAVEAGNALQAAAKGFVPVDTGALQASIHMRAYTGDGFGVAMVAPGTDYDIFVEYGTGRRGGGATGDGGGNRSYTHDHPGQAPQPYMHPAYELAKAQLESTLGKAMAQALSG